MSISSDYMAPVRYRIESLENENATLRKENRRLNEMIEEIAARELDDAPTLKRLRTKRMVEGYYEAARRSVRMARLYDGPTDARTVECLHLVARYRKRIADLRGAA